MHRLALSLILSALALAAGQARPQSTIYSVTPLDLGDGTGGLLNSSGQIAGSTTGWGVPRVWKDGVSHALTLAQLPEGVYRDYYTVVGTVQNNAGVAQFIFMQDLHTYDGNGQQVPQTVYRTYEWSNSQFQEVDSANGTRFVRGLNDAGNTAGTIAGADGRATAYATVNGTTSTITAPGAQTFATHINNQNQVAGLIWNDNVVWQDSHAYPDAPLQGFIWNNGQTTSLGALYSVEALNDRGDVVGLRQRDDGSKQLTLIKDGQDIDLLPGFRMVAGTAWLTADDVTVASFSYEVTFDIFARATYVISGGETFLLDDLVDPNRKLDYLTVQSVNDKGEILVSGYDRLTKQTVTALLQPHAIPEPETWVLVGLGLLAAGAAARRRRRAFDATAAA